MLRGQVQLVARSLSKTHLMLDSLLRLLTEISQYICEKSESSVHSLMPLRTSINEKNKPSFTNKKAWKNYIHFSFAFSTHIRK